MSSVTSTGICLWPLCTPKVSPTNCGRIVERRDHILITAFEPDPRALSAFFSKYPSTNGPFQIERATSLTFLLYMPAAQDKLVGCPVVPRLLALGGLAPGRHRMPSARSAALAAAMRVIDRVHGNAAHHRAASLPAHPTCLADRDVGVVGVGHRTYCRHAGGRHHACLAGIEPKDGVACIATDKLHIGAGRARDLATLADLHLHIVDNGADRHVSKRHGIARLHIDAGIGNHRIAGLEPLRREDVGELTVLLFDQRDERRAVGIEFEPLHGGRHAELAALEIDHSVAALVPAAAMPHGHAALVVAATRFGRPSVSALTGLPFHTWLRSMSTS